MNEHLKIEKKMKESLVKLNKSPIKLLTTQSFSSPVKKNGKNFIRGGDNCNNTL